MLLILVFALFVVFGPIQLPTRVSFMGHLVGSGRFSMRHLSCSLRFWCMFTWLLWRFEPRNAILAHWGSKSYQVVGKWVRPSMNRKWHRDGRHSRQHSLMSGREFCSVGVVMDRERYIFGQIDRCPLKNVYLCAKVISIYELRSSIFLRSICLWICLVFIHWFFLEW